MEAVKHVIHRFLHEGVGLMTPDAILNARPAVNLFTVIHLLQCRCPRNSAETGLKILCHLGSGPDR